jgi:hypothetical protein
MRNTAVILNEGMNCLLDKLGVLETEIFISHLLREPFDYTAWQKEHYAAISVNELNQKAIDYIKTNGAAL